MFMIKKLNIAIVGASGYTGFECYRLALKHPNIDKITLVALSNAGLDIKALNNHFYKNSKILQKLEDVDFSAIDVVFFCLPHGQSQKIIMQIYNEYSNVKIIDLSADFRFDNTEVYENIYGTTHIAKNIQKNDVAYGLCEITKPEDIKAKRIIACPGCYPTSAILPLFALIKLGIVNKNSIVIDSKSAISGAGRKEQAQYLFAERSDNVIAYNVFKHRHRSEIAEKLDLDIQNVLFTPHLVPITRGIESTIYAKLQNKNTASDAKKAVADFYKNSPFVTVVDFCPSTSLVKGTNNCLIYMESEGENIIISSVIDNICKGSSGSAIQAMNIAFDLEQTTALENLQGYL
jgi:N-acetyl-gamma-glutamyl-phosphate reductase